MKPRRFRALYLAPALALLALMAWALASPVGASPDDDFHLASIWCANEANTGACKTTSNSSERIVPPIVHFAPCFAHQPLQSAACQNKYFAEGSRPSVLTDRGSFQENYPPVYYGAMSLFVGPDIAAAVVVMRLVNILIFIAFTTALFMLLPRARRPTLLWGWMISLVPLGMFILASNNPSSWAIIGIGSAWLALLGYFETTGRRRFALGVVFVLAAVVAAGSRGDAALYLVLSVVVVVILTFARTRGYLILAILPVTMSVVGVAFFLSSRQSTVVVSGLSSVGGVTPKSANLVALAINDAINVPSLWSGVFGTWDLGWLDTALPAIVPLGAMSAFIAALFVGLSQLVPRKLVALAVVALALLLIPTYVLVKGLNVVGENVQPRYVLPLIVMVGGLAMLTDSGRTIEFTKTQVAILVGGIAIAESIALYTNMRRYVSGAAGHGINLDVAKGWWWSVSPSPMFVWIVGSAAFAALLVILIREMNRAHVID